MKTIKTLLALALLGAAACDGAPTGASALSAEPALAQSPGVLAFTSTPSSSERNPQAASGELARIDFTGSMLTGQPCYTVAGSHTTRGSEVTLTVTAIRMGEVCAQVVTYHNYQGSVAALTPGTYTFTVVHEVGSNRTTAFSGTVVVQ